MKIIALNSSARKGGNTEQLLGLLEEALRGLAGGSGVSLEYEYIALYDLNLGLCRGCRLCFDKGEEKCSMRDGLPALYAKLQNADAVIAASPVYVEDVSGVMKNFIDRMAFNCHRPSFAGKTALLLTTSGMGSSGHSLRTMRYAFGSWGFHIAGTAKFSMGALMKKEETAEKFRTQADKLTGKLFSALTQQKPLKPSLLSLIIFRVQQKCYLRDTEASYDRAWWTSRGYLEKSVSFYMPHRANPVKVFIAKFLSVPIAKMFT
jgi:multimeric flavodoxin WrbA